MYCRSLVRIRLNEDSFQLLNMFHNKNRVKDLKENTHNETVQVSHQLFATLTTIRWEINNIQIKNN